MQSQTSPLQRATRELDPSTPELASAALPVTTPPIQHFPPELLSRILHEYIHRHKGRPQAVLRTCRSWYDTIIYAAELWTVIRMCLTSLSHLSLHPKAYSGIPEAFIYDYYEADRLIPWVQSHIRLSGDMPVEIDLYGDQEALLSWDLYHDRHQAVDFLDIFFGTDGSISRRCKKLVMIELPNEAELLRKYPFPILEDYETAREITLTTLFDQIDHFPKLTSFGFLEWGTHIPETVHVTRIHAKPIYYDDAFSRFLEIPTLEVLYVDFPGDMFTSSGAGLNPPPFTHSLLRTLELIHSGNKAIRYFPSNAVFNFPSLQTLHLVNIAMKPEQTSLAHSFPSLRRCEIVTEGIDHLRDQHRVYDSMDPLIAKMPMLERLWVSDQPLMDRVVEQLQANDEMCPLIRDINAPTLDGDVYNILQHRAMWLKEERGKKEASSS